MFIDTNLGYFLLKVKYSTYCQVNKITALPVGVAFTNLLTRLFKGIGTDELLVVVAPVFKDGSTVVYVMVSDVEVFHVIFL